MDANFRLKSRLRGAINKEPSLGLGWSYFVDDALYSDFIKGHIDQNEVRVNGHLLEVDLLTAGIDTLLRWFSGTPQHAHQKVKRSPCNWYCCRQQRSSPTLSAIGYG